MFTIPLSPLVRFPGAIIAIGVLLDDFFGYLDGEEATLGPVWDKVIEVFRNIKQAVQDAVEAIKGFITESFGDDGKFNWVGFGTKLGTWLLQGAKNVLSRFGSLVKTWITGNENAGWDEVGEAIVGKIEAAIRLALGVGNSILGILVGIVNDAITPENVSALLTNGASFIKGILDGITAAIPNIGEDLQTTIETLVTGLIGLLNTVTSDKFTQSLGAFAANFITGLGKAIGTAFTSAGEIVTGLTTMLETALNNLSISGMTENLSNFGKQIISAIVEGISKVTTGAGDFIEAIGKFISTALGSNGTKDISDSLTSFGQSMIDAIVEGIGKVTDSGNQLLGKIVGAINDVLTPENVSVLITNGANFVKGIFGAINKSIPELGEDVESIFETVMGGVTNLLNTITSDQFKEALGSLATNLITGLGEAIGLALSSAGNILSGITTLLSDALTAEGNEGFMTSLGELGGQIIKAIGEGIKKAANGAASLIEVIGDILADALNGGKNGQSPIDDLSGFGQTILDAIIKALGDIGDAAKQIMEAIAGLFSGINWDDVAVDLSSLVTGLITKIIEAFGNEGIDWEGIVGAIGKGLGTAVNALSTVATTLVDELIKYILQPENWAKLGEGIINILKAAVTGLGEFLDAAINGDNSSDMFDYYLDDSYLSKKMEKWIPELQRAQTEAYEKGLANAPDLRMQLDLMGINTSEMSDEDIAADWGRSIAKLQIDSYMAELEAEGQLKKPQIEALRNALYADLDEVTNAQKSIVNDPNAAVTVDYGVIWDRALYGTDYYGNEHRSMQQIIDDVNAMADEVSDGEYEANPNIDVEPTWETSAVDAMNDEIRNEMESGEDADQTITPSVSIDGVNVETGESDGIQEATQEAVDNVLANQTFSADVTVKTNVTVEVGDSNAESIGTEIGSKIGENISSSVSSTNPFSSLITKMREVFGKISEIVNGAVSKINSKLQSIASKAGSVGSSAASNFKSSIGGLPSWVQTNIVDKINRSLATIKSPKISTPSLTGNSEGGVIEKETVSRLGEGDKREYVIPVTKPNRAVPLLKRAAADLGLSVQSYANATKLLGGSPDKAVTPAHAAAAMTNNSVANHYNTIDAHAEIHVTGSDPRSTANNVNKSHEQVLLRNVKPLLT